MMWYCEKCRAMHDNDELCPNIQVQLKAHPEWLTEAANFAVIAGEYNLVSSNSLDSVAQAINHIVDTNLTYEGTHQFARDIQVFKRLDVETFSRAGYFSSPEAAKKYLETIEQADELKRAIGVTDARSFVMPSLDRKLTGASQEVDWCRFKESKLSSLRQKNRLLNGNAAGVDGETINRFNGKTISRTTVKASINPIDKNSTGVRDVVEAIDKGYATSEDIVFAPKGTTKAIRDAGLTNPVIEKNNPEQIQASNERLKGKIRNGQATTAPTTGQVAQKTLQGAVVGAAIELTISSITSYVRYKNGEITRDEAFRTIGESGVKGALVGGTLAATTIFLPEGIIGFVAGMAIGIYISTLTRNILDEVFGKGCFEQVLHMSGYIYGTSIALQDALKEIQANHQAVLNNIEESTVALSLADENINAVLASLGGNE